MLKYLVMPLAAVAIALAPLAVSTPSYAHTSDKAAKSDSKKDKKAKKSKSSKSGKKDKKTS